MDDRAGRGAVPGRCQDGPEVARSVPWRRRRRFVRSIESSASCHASHATHGAPPGACAYGARVGGRTEVHVRRSGSRPRRRNACCGDEGCARLERGGRGGLIARCGVYQRDTSPAAIIDVAVQIARPRSPMALRLARQWPSAPAATDSASPRPTGIAATAICTATLDERQPARVHAHNATPNEQAATVAAIESGTARLPQACVAPPRRQSPAANAIRSRRQRRVRRKSQHSGGRTVRVHRAIRWENEIGRLERSATNRRRLHKVEPISPLPHRLGIDLEPLRGLHRRPCDRRERLEHRRRPSGVDRRVGMLGSSVGHEHS